MALPAHSLEVIAPYLRGAEVLSLGYPDLIAKPEDIVRILGFVPKVMTDYNIWHGVKHQIPETAYVFEAAGAKLTIVDFTKERGMEVIADLNERQDLGKFDLVIDPGTLEHCFNIGQALINAAEAVKSGGRIMHLSPMTMVNHGFYNLCPTLFYDFYHQNDWEVDHLAIIPITHVECKLTDRINTTVEYLLRCFARRKTEAPMRIPVQTKYLKKIHRAEQQKQKAA